MSATINHDIFVKYFGNAPLLTIPGFAHPVQDRYAFGCYLSFKYSFPCLGILKTTCLRCRTDREGNRRKGYPKRIKKQCYQSLLIPLSTKAASLPYTLSRARKR